MCTMQFLIVKLLYVRVRESTMLDFVSTRKLASVSTRPKSNVINPDVRKITDKRQLYDSRPHSYHENLSGSVMTEKFSNVDNSKSVAQRITSKLLTSLNCMQTDIDPTLHRVHNTVPTMIEFGAGGGFTDVSRTWRFHPFRMR